MDQEFYALLNEYELKIQKSTQINEDLLRLLNSMKLILMADKENVIKLESTMQNYSIIESDIVDFNVGGKCLVDR
jgi:hypothetical protein